MTNPGHEFLKMLNHNIFKSKKLYLQNDLDLFLKIIFQVPGPGILQN